MPRYKNLLRQLIGGLAGPHRFWQRSTQIRASLGGILMISRLGAVVVGAVLATSGVAAAAPGVDTGMAGAIHDLRKEGKRVCIVGHYHYGSGTGGTKKRAEADAIASWASFTDLEYGSAWANFQKAANRRLSCSTGVGGFSCNVEARPCR